MRYEARVIAYDVLDQIHVSMSVQRSNAPTTDSETIFHLVTDFPGTGEDSPPEWLKDVLIAALERL